MRWHWAHPAPPLASAQFLSSDGVQLTGGSTYRMDWRKPPPANPLAFWAVQVVDLDDLTYPNVDAPFITGEDHWMDIFGYVEGPSFVSLNNSTSVRDDGSFSIM